MTTKEPGTGAAGSGGDGTAGADAAAKAAADAAAKAAGSGAAGGEKKPDAAAKADAGTLAGGETGAEAKGGAQGAPEKYAAFTMPEGVEMDAALVEKASGVFKGLNLSQEQAQQLVDLQAATVKEQTDQIQEGFKAQVAQWKDETLKAFGPKAKEELGYVAKAVERFGTPDLRTLFNQTGIGNHKAVNLFLAKIGRAISEEKPADGTRAGGAEKSTAELMYPSMTKRG